MIEQMLKIHQFAVMCAPTMSQFAAIEAMRSCDEDIDAMRAEYDTRRRLLVDGLNGIGLDCFEPQGAFYVFSLHSLYRADQRAVLRKASV